MYIAGRLRTASSPSRTLILSALYSATSSALPCPLLPGTASADVTSSPDVCSVSRRSGVRSKCSIRPSSPAVLFSVAVLDADRHDHVRVVVAFCANRFYDRLAHLILHVERHDVGTDSGEEIEHVLSVEANLHRPSRILDGKRLVRFTKLRTARGHIHFAFLNVKLDGSRPLVRQQRNPLDRIGQPVALEFDVLVVGFGNDPFVSRELTVDH